MLYGKTRTIKAIMKNRSQRKLKVTIGASWSPTTRKECFYGNRAPTPP